MIRIWCFNAFAGRERGIDCRDQAVKLLAEVIMLTAHGNILMGQAIKNV
ncbi:MAG: hypothetical protein ACLTZT_12775 [Butyricimonas faecalis]